MSGITIETRIRNTNYDIRINLKIQFIINSGQSNSNKISNEDSTNNNYTISNQTQLSRYSGSDKLDNTKRINYGLDINKLSIKLSQNYELSKNSNYHKEAGNDDYLSDLLGNASYNTSKNTLSYDVRYDVDQNGIRKQSISYENDSIFGVTNFTYIDEKTETNSILTSGNEAATLKFDSIKFKKYHRLNFDTKYNMITNQINQYRVGYKYFDECFGINLDYSRLYYTQGTLKPKDNLTLMFSFKNLGSYKSTNLAVSEIDKQDIQWEGGSVSNEEFY